MSQNVLSPEMFISYSWSDRPFVEQLVEDLARHGITVWYDRWIMNPGDKLIGKVGEGLRYCKYFGIVISRKSLESSWVQYELDAALVRFIEDKSVRIIPILIGDVEGKEMPVSLRSIVYIDFRNLDNYAQRLQELVNTIVIPLPTNESPFIPKSIRGPLKGWLEEELFGLATDPNLLPKDEKDLAAKWSDKYCRAHRADILMATDYLIGRNYANSHIVQDLIQCLNAIFTIHELPVRQIPQQMLRVMDDDEYNEDARGVTIHVAGLLDYPLGESRIRRLLSRRSGKVIYSVCEYIEYRIGILESEEIAKSLLAVMNRPDSISYFTALDTDTGKEVEADVRYYAARCLALSELSPEIEQIIVGLIRTKYPEVEDEVSMMLINSIALGALTISGSRGRSRLWKRYSGSLESVFQRVDDRKSK